MSAPKHTPEPWEVDEGYGHEIPRDPAVYIFNNDAPVNQKLPAIARGINADHNAVRIVDCVNALAGIADPAAYRAKVDALRDAAKHLTDEVYTIDSPVMHALADRILAALVDLDGGWKS